MNSSLNLATLVLGSQLLLGTGNYGMHQPMCRIYVIVEQRQGRAPASPQKFARQCTVTFRSNIVMKPNSRHLMDLAVSAHACGSGLHPYCVLLVSFEYPAMFVLTQASRRGRSQAPAEQRDRRRRLVAAGTRVLGGKTSQQVRLRYRLTNKSSRFRENFFNSLLNSNECHVSMH